jgi:hypothetical protein
MSIQKRFSAMLLAAVVLASPIAVQSQDFGMVLFNDSVDLTNAYVAQSAMSSVFNAQPLTAPIPRVAIDFSVLRFERDSAISARVRDRFRDQLVRKQPDRIADIDRALEQNWLQAYVLEIAARNGLDAKNLADANTGYLIASWALVNNVITLDPRGILSVRDQMRAALANSQQAISMSDAEKQEAAETLIYDTVLVMANRVQIASSGDTALQRAAAEHYAAGFRELGIDLSALDLTPYGFVSTR